MQGVWIYILSGEQFKLTFENTQWRKVKTKATSVNTHHRRQAVLEDKCSPRVKEGKYGRQLCKNSFSCAGNWSTHTGDKPRPCAKCNKVLKNAACLRGHLLSHTWKWMKYQPDWHFNSFSSVGEQVPLQICEQGFLFYYFWNLGEIKRILTSDNTQNNTNE